MNAPGHNLASHFWDHALDHTAEQAWWDGARQRYQTWGELAADVARGCEWLSSLRLASGSRIATQWPNSVEWIIVDLACQTLGLVHLPVDIRETRSASKQLVQQADALWIDHLPEQVLNNSGNCIERDTARRWLQQAQTQPLDALAQLLSTSGTTGTPRLVSLTHRNLLVNAWQKLNAAPQDADDVRLNLLPFSHAYARTCELSAWILSRSRLAVAANWDQWLEWGPAIKPTLINLVPYLAEAFAKLEPSTQSAVGDRLRLLQVGGAPLQAGLWSELASRGWAPLQGYGLTEASPVVCSNRAGQQQPGTVGPAVAGTMLRIDAEQLLWLRGPQVMHGYWNDPEATQQVMQDGWLCTGDIVEETPGGMRIVGRQSQVIVLSTGYKVSPELVEARLLLLEDVEQAVVVGDGSPHITAWLWPRMPRVRPELHASTELGRSVDLAHPTTQTIDSLDTDRWLQSVAKRIVGHCADLPGYAIPRDLRLLPTPLSIASGTLTRKGTPLRHYFSAAGPADDFARRGYDAGL